jgi:hypothetical protein
LTDDGHPQPLAAWADRELFRGHGSLRVQRQERGGLHLTGRFHSDQWDMDTVLRFTVSDDLVQRLDVAAI